MQYATDFAGQNWLITPAALAVNEPAPSGIAEQKWLLTLSGVVIPNLKGGAANDWLRETLLISPDTSGPMEYATARFGIPRPDHSHPVFTVEQWAPFGGISSIFDQDNIGNAGFAVDTWRPHPFRLLRDVNGRDVTNVFSGVQVDVAVRDLQAVLHRVSYHFSLLGRIRFVWAIG